MLKFMQQKGVVRIEPQICVSALMSKQQGQYQALFITIEGGKGVKTLSKVTPFHPGLQFEIAEVGRV